jgi:hypothetical protein
VTVEWDGYKTYDPGYSSPLNTLPRTEARRAFARRMEQKSTRIELLRKLLEANGVKLSTTEPGLQDLNDWFVPSVEPDGDHPGHLTSDWSSVAHDVSLFLGDVMIERCPGLHWEFYTGGKKDVSFQRHVIMGFTQVPNPKYNVDIDRRVTTYANRILASKGSIAQYGKVTVRGVEIDVDAAVARQPAKEIESDAFWRWVKLAETQA